MLPPIPRTHKVEGENRLHKAVCPLTSMGAPWHVRLHTHTLSHTPNKETQQLCCLFWFFETGSHCVAMASLEFASNPAGLALTEFIF